MKLSRGSGVPLIRLNKSIAFDGTAGNGATGTVTVYTITGQVQVVTFVPFCTESLAEAASNPMCFVPLAILGISLSAIM